MTVTPDFSFGDPQRSTVIEPLELLGAGTIRLASYTATLNRMAYQRVLPASWSDLLDDVRAFVDPLVGDTSARLQASDPVTQRWSS